MKVTFTDFDVKITEEDLSQIDSCFEKLRVSVDRHIQNNLEYAIYSFSWKISDIKRSYIRNKYLLQQAKDKEFTKRRGKENSDLATTKAINKDFIEENNFVSLQELIVEWLEDKQKHIKRLADHINDMRIADLSDAKRQ